jgi:hypothetical protein
MQICMKATAEQLSDIKGRIEKASAATSLSLTEIGRISRVHPSQVSRICRGDFKTISHNVVQVCRALGLKLESVAARSTRKDASWSKLEASVRSIWDQTPEGAEKIARVLRTIGELRPPRRR